jgi:hypothetical protein
MHLRTRKPFLHRAPRSAWMYRNAQNESAPDSLESRDARSNNPPPKTVHYHLNGLTVCK